MDEINLHLVALGTVAVLTILSLSLAYSLGFFTTLRTKTMQFIPWKDCFQVFLVFLFLQFFLAPLLAVGFIFGKGAIVRDPELMGWLNVVAVFIVLIFLGFFLFRYKKDQLLGFFYSKQPVHDILLGSFTWCLAFPIVLVYSLMMQIILGDYFGFPLDDQIAVKQIKEIMEYPALLYATIAMVVFLIPIIEEVLFRGFLQTSLRSYFGPLASIVLCSLIFALFHFSSSQGVNNFNILGSLFFLSLFLGFLRERQGNCLAPIAMHSTFNAISIVLMLS